MTIQREVLGNGLTLLTERIEHLRSISFGVWLKKGSRDESSEHAGVYHFIEHMLFKGTSRRNAFEIAQIFDAIGGFNDAFTTKENTCFYAKILDEHLPVILDLFSDILMHPKFDAEDLEKERNVIHEEIKMVDDTPSDLVHEEFLQKFWPQHPLGRPILGSTETVDSITTSKIRDQFRRNYVPSNMLITAAGNIDHQRLAHEIRMFFDLTGDAAPAVVSPPVNPQSFVHLFRKPNLEQAHVCMGVMAHSADAPERYAAGVMNTILGGSMSSRLFQKIREDRGLCYSIQSSISSFLDYGYLNIYAAVSPENLRTACELMLDECRLLMREPVDRGELENAKNHLKGSLILSLESSSNRMFNLARNEIYHNRQITTEETLEKIEAVTAEDVQRVAVDLFNEKPCSMVVVGDLEGLDFRMEDLRIFA